MNPLQSVAALLTTASRITCPNLDSGLYRAAKQKIEDFRKFPNFENCHSAHKSSWNVLPWKTNLFLDSFRVLIERLADSGSWMTSREALRAPHISEIGNVPWGAYTAVQGTGRWWESKIEDFLKISNFENCHSAHKSLWNVLLCKTNLFLDSFRVLIERLADSESWMTSLEALRALHISEIGNVPWGACTGTQYRAQGGSRSEIEDFLKFSNFENCHRARKSLWNVCSYKIIMVLDIFRVLIERLADSGSWMTSLEALRALRFRKSSISLFPPPPCAL